jgi:hypothetical protein
MEKKSGTPFYPKLLKGLCHIHEMVVMDPYIIGLGAVFCCNLSEFTVYIEILLPIPGFKVATSLQIMKQGPDHLIGESIVVIADLIG